jgi:hypothetical protein
MRDPSLIAIQFAFGRGLTTSCWWWLPQPPKQQQQPLGAISSFTLSVRHWIRRHCGKANFGSAAAAEGRDKEHWGRQGGRRGPCLENCAAKMLAEDAAATATATASLAEESLL